MEVPTHLQHKPIIAVNDYDKIDGFYANNSDAKALSIGQAQYDENEFSLKVWRHSKKRWSPQSEELPIHRNIDLSILLLDVLLIDVTSNLSIASLKEEIIQSDRVKELQAYCKDKRKLDRQKLEELRNKLNKFLDK